MQDEDLPEFLRGDGRCTLDAQGLSETLRVQSLRVTRAQARRVVRMFRDHGASLHSQLGGTMWVVLAYCREEEIPVQIEVWPGLGFRVARIQPQPKGEPT